MNPLTLQMFGVPVAGQRPPLAEADGFGDFAVVMDKAETADRALPGDPLIELPLADPALPDPSMLFAPPLVLPVPQRPATVGPQSQPISEPQIAPATAVVAAPNVVQTGLAGMVLAPPPQDIPLQSPPLQKQVPDLPSAAMVVPKPDFPLEMPLPERHEASPQPAAASPSPPEQQRAADTVIPPDLTADRAALPQHLGETVLEFRSNSSRLSDPSFRRPENRAAGQAAVLASVPDGAFKPVTPGLPPAEPIMQAARTASRSIAAHPNIASPVSDLTSSPAAILTTAVTVSADASLPRPETTPPDFVRTYPASPVVQARNPAAPQRPIGSDPVQIASPLAAPLITTAPAVGTMPPEPVITPPAEPQRIATSAQASDQLAEAQPQIAPRAPPKLPTQVVLIDAAATSEPPTVDAAVPAPVAAASSAESAWQMRLQLPAPRLHQPLHAAPKSDPVPPHAGSDKAKPPTAQVNARVEPPFPAQTAPATSPDLSPEAGPAPDFNADPPATEAASPEPKLAQLSPTAAALPEPAIRPPQSEVATPIAMPTAIPAKVAAQIVPHAHRAKAGAVEVVLHPEELGSVKFQIQPQGESVRVVLTVERPETLEFLRRHADHLVQEFRQAGFSGATLSFGSWGQQGGQPDPPPPPPMLPVEDLDFVPPVMPRVVTHSATDAGQGLNLRL